MSFAEDIKTIVVATDLDGRSGTALEYARRLALAYGSRIVLAHGLDPLDYAAVQGVSGAAIEQLDVRARAALAKMAGELMGEGIPSHSEVRQGAVVQMLLEVARQYGAGLIVVGTEGRHGAGPVVVGAVAEQLVRSATCPVLAVAADWNAGSFRPMPGGPVLLALARNESSQPAVQAAQSLARTFKRSLVAVHARRPEEAAAFLNPGTTTLEEFGIEPSKDFPARLVVEDGGPTEAILAAIEHFRPAILVVGAKRVSASPDRHGTVFGLLARSRVPVFCVPSQAVLPVSGRESEIVEAAS